MHIQTIFVCLILAFAVQGQTQTSEKKEIPISKNILKTEGTIKPRKKPLPKAQVVTSSPIVLTEKKKSKK